VNVPASTWRSVLSLAAAAEVSVDRALAPQQLVAAEARALDVLDAGGPRSQVALGRAIGRSKPATSRLVDRLAHRGLVTRTPSTIDTRVVNVELTDAGRAQLAAVRPTYSAALAAHDAALAQLAHQIDGGDDR
jgi:DNA-binding MarR family transcriptional regulator